MFDKLLNFFFPTVCISCNAEKTIICKSCFNQIPKDIFYQNKTLSIYSYKNKLVDELLWKLKYHHCGDVAIVFGKTIAEEFVKNIKKDFSQVDNIILIPIPLTKGDRRLFNHAELIAKELMTNILKIISDNPKHHNILLYPNLLIKNTKKKQAHTKDKLERFENIKNSFEINTSVKIPIGDNFYIIVDDVTTTGATINEARVTLSKFLNVPQNEIQAITIAH